MVLEVEVVLLKGDITSVDCDAIVNPANSLLVMGGGVAWAIKKRGGEVIEKEAREKAPVRVGDAVVTGAGSLKARYVIHAPTMERPAMRTTLEKARQATRAALTKAGELGVKCVAFPGMGTGVGGLDPIDAARVMVEEILSWKPSRSDVKVILVAYDNRMYDAFRIALVEKGFISRNGSVWHKA
jgi:O-acetyl-ADP-ribose deacetylase (regulator of RNase III)